MSKRAEALLKVSEQQTVGLAITRLLRTTGTAEGFVALLHDAVLGGTGHSVSCWVGEHCDDPAQVRAQVQLGPCGPPPGALLLLNL